MKIQLLIVALLVGTAVGYEWGFWPRRPRPPPIPTEVTNWAATLTRSDYNVNVTIIVEPSVYTSAIAPVFSQLGCVLPQAGVQVSDVANGKSIFFTNIAVRNIISFLTNAQNDTTSAVTIANGGSTASFARASTQFLFQAVTQGGKQIGANIPTANVQQPTSNIQLLFRNFRGELAERIWGWAMTTISTLNN